MVLTVEYCIRVHQRYYHITFILLLISMHGRTLINLHGFKYYSFQEGQQKLMKLYIMDSRVRSLST